MTLQSCQNRWARLIAPLVWLAVIQVFVISLLASSPDLHERCHSDSHESDHHCLATDLQSGTVDQTVIVPVVAPDFQPVLIATVTVSVIVRHTLPHHLCGSLLAHGPPVIA